MTVDVHAHVLLPAVEELVAGAPGHAEHRALDAARNGEASLAASGRMIAERLPRLLDLDARLAAMDASGVDSQVVSVSPSQYHYWAEPELAKQVVKQINEGVAALCAQRPDRLTGLGTIALQHPESAVDDLEHAVLGCGLCGVQISSHAPTGASTVELSDDRLSPLWARAEELGAVVFVHPFGCTLDARLDRWYLSNSVGQPVENAVALSHLIFSGVLDRHPDLRLLFSHGGGYLPTYLGRADHAWRTRPDARSCRDLPSSYVRRVHFDSLVHTPQALRALVLAVGPEQVLLGSDYPFDMGVEDPVTRLDAAGLAPRDRDRIAHGNARRLGLLPQEES
ncbi:amidohydrolase [Lentzea pudingi]|uniref:Amidohydrolase n=1 Tax=Lentzea pudingi TaxID=1789439 RepID=A0ABQ2HYW3_9PSEU|nr:amidohydrolase family protein [Lentzea pudingi]GGM94835.1 amidohydrolase [Lentzea pudingi]